MPILLKLFQNIAEEGTIPNSFYKATITLIPKPYKNRNSKNLTEAEDIKKRWQEYTGELCKKDVYNPYNHDGMITHLEPDILECEVKWPWKASLQTKLVEVMEFQLSYFKS